MHAATLAALLSAPACLLDWDRLDPANGVGGAGQGGGAGVCTPGETAPCYSGPTGTEGIGSCTGGETTCNPDGSGFGPCTGEVIPIAEDCDTSADDDCDGEANELDAGCSCTPGELRNCYDGAMGTQGVGVCVGGTKMCGVGGDTFTACVGQVLPSLEECFTPADDDCDGSSNEGCPLWALRFGAFNNVEDYANDTAIDASGNVLIAGEADDGNLDFGGAVLPSGGGGWDAVVAKLNGNGGHVWSRRWGDDSDSGANGIAVDGAGNVYVTGYFGGTVDFGTGPLSPGLLVDAFVVKLSAAGSALWATRLSGPAGVRGAADIAVDAAGTRVVVTGLFIDSIDVGNGVELAFDSSFPDGFVVSLNAADGSIAWGRIFGEDGDDLGSSVAMDNAGNAFVGGFFDALVNLGGTTTLTATGAYDAFVGKLGPTGAALWLVGFGGGDDQLVRHVEVAPDQSPIVAGDFFGDINFGAGAVLGAGSWDGFVAKLATASGAPSWTETFGGAGEQNLDSLTVDSGGNVWIGIEHELIADYGGGPVLSAGDDDWALVKLDPMGQHLRSLRFGDGGDDEPHGLAVDGSDNLVAVGDCTYTMDFGLGPMSGDDIPDICVAKLPP